MLNFPTNTQVASNLSQIEAFHTLLATQPLGELVLISYTKTISPLYPLLLRLQFIIFGVNELSVRGFSILLLILASIVTFLIGRKMWGKKTGLWSAFLLLLNPLMIENSLSNPIPILFALTILLSTYFFVSKKWKSYVIVTILALHTHHFALFFVASQYTWIFYEFIKGKRIRVKKRLIALTVIIAIYIPRMMFLKSILSPSLPSQLPNTTQLLENTATLLAGSSAQYSLFNTYISTYMIILFLLATVLLLKRWRRKVAKYIFILYPAILASALVYLFSLKVFPIFDYYYLSIAIPFIYLFCISSKQKISIIPLTLLVLFYLFINVTYLLEEPEQDYHLLKNKIQSGEQIIITDDSINNYWQLQYYDIPTSFIQERNALSFSLAENALIRDDVNSEVQGHSKLGFLSDKKDLLISGYKYDSTEDIGALTITWYVPE